MKRILSILLIFVCILGTSIKSLAFTLEDSDSLNNSYGTLTCGFSDNGRFGSTSNGDYFELSGTSTTKFTGIPGQTNAYKNNWKTLKNITDKFEMGYTKASYSVGVSLSVSKSGLNGGVSAGVSYTESTACDSILWPEKGMYNWYSSSYSINGHAKDITFIKHSYSAQATFYGAGNLSPNAYCIEYR